MTVRIVIVTPQVGQVATGNRCSADQWEKVFLALGHEVVVTGVGDDVGSGFDVLVALNAKRIHGVIEEFKAKNPIGRVIVVLTGTDIYPEPGKVALESMEKADWLVALQGKAVAQVPVEWRGKITVILQAAVAGESREKSSEFFDVAVVGHLRKVKDPMQTAAASRLLPDDSRVRVRQVGAILEDDYGDLIQKEMADNPRYECLGELNPTDAALLTAGSHLLVVSSLSEGAPRVVGEAVVNGTPVVSSRIDGVVGLLGEDYPGYFSVGDTEELSKLIWKAESDEIFYQELIDACRKVAGQFSPEAEIEAWRSLLEELK